MKLVTFAYEISNCFQRNFFVTKRMIQHACHWTNLCASTWEIYILCGHDRVKCAGTIAFALQNNYNVGSTKGCRKVNPLTQRGGKLLFPFSLLFQSQGCICFACSTYCYQPGCLYLPPKQWRSLLREFNSWSVDHCFSSDLFSSRISFLSSVSRFIRCDFHSRFHRLAARWMAKLF